MTRLCVLLVSLVVAVPAVAQVPRPVETQTSAPPAPKPELLHQNDLAYEGAFRVPETLSDKQTLAYGGTALSFWPAHNSLLLVGHDHHQLVAEISIPTPTQATTVAALPRATWLQPPTDILQGRRVSGVDGGKGNGVKVGGITVVDPHLIVNVWTYYDASQTPQTLTHFVAGQDFAAPTAVEGPFQVGRGFQDYNRKDVARIGGFVSGYMTTIPAQWQGPLGGTHLTGQGGGISILGRTSSGPSATVFTPTELSVATGRDGAAPRARPRDTKTNAFLVMGYPTNSSNPKDELHQPTLGVWGKGGGVYDGTQIFRGMVFPDGTRSILFFGWGGTRFCYGGGTNDPKLDLTPHPQGGHWCYDPANDSKGTHGYPYRSLVFAYDVLDFIAVKQGKRKPWEIKPYATWSFAMPFQQKLDANGVDRSDYAIVGAAYDPATRRIFLTAYRTDENLPIVHVFRLPPLRRDESDQQPTKKP